MKIRTHHLFLFLSLLLFSCSGSDDSNEELQQDITPGDYFIKFEVDGTPMEYGFTVGEDGNFSTVAWASVTNNAETGGGFGTVTTQFTGNSFVLTAMTSEPIEPDRIFDIGNSFFYGYYRVGNVSYLPESMMKIIWTDISAEEVQGTFSGTYQNSQDDTFVELTDGEFFLPRVVAENPPQQ